MDVGAISAGIEVVAASELDAYACKTFRANHPTCNLYEGDIKDHFDEITAISDVDVVFGGPPCQGFSVAGKMDLSDPRSELVYMFCKVVEAILPKAFVMENVKALGVLNKFEIVRKEIFKRMEAAGYRLSMHVLNAKDFGVPQSRERVFFVGVKEGRSLHSIDFEYYKQTPPTLREAIAHLGRAGGPLNSKITKAKITLAEKPVLRKSPYAGMMFNGQGRPLNPDGWSSTLPASMGGNRTPIIDEDHLYDFCESWVEKHHEQLMNGEKKPEYKEAPMRLRRLTIDEARIIQTFPDKYIFEGPSSRVFSQIGNAVPCKLAEVVFSALTSLLNGQELSVNSLIKQKEIMF